MKIILPIALLAIICSNKIAAQDMSASQKTILTNQILKMNDSLCKDLKSKGPVSWLYYFLKSPSFFMANDGKLVFADNKVAVDFIQDTLSKIISSVSLQWNDMKIEILTQSLAAVHSYYHETLAATDGKLINANGYFTAVAEKKDGCWKFRNLHWSSAK